MQTVHLLAILVLFFYLATAVLSIGLVLMSLKYGNSIKLGGLSFSNEKVVSFIPKLSFIAKVLLIFLVLLTSFWPSSEEYIFSGYFFLWFALAVDILGEKFVKKHLALRFAFAFCIICLVSSSSYLAHRKIVQVVSPYDYHIVLYAHILSSLIGFTSQAIFAFLASCYLLQDVLLKKNFALALNIKLPSQGMLFSSINRFANYSFISMSFAILFGVIQSWLIGVSFFHDDFISYLGFTSWFVSFFSFLVIVISPNFISPSFNRFVLISMTLLSLLVFFLLVGSCFTASFGNHYLLELSVYSLQGGKS
jgi:hypothetical protein